jgi:anaphase-promoting complex subunit 6
LFNNLGHTSRKLGKFDDALRYHRKALVLQPQSASTISAIAYIHALKGDLIEAGNLL